MNTELPDPHVPINIWCTLVMNTENTLSYVAGAMTMAYSLIQTDTKYQIWCMVGPEISQDDRNMLKKVFHQVIEVPIIQHKSVPEVSPILQARHGAWIEKSYTKWNIFNPATFMVDGMMYNVCKVLFVDADVIFIENCDHLFDLNAPAAMFANAWVKPYADRGANPFGELRHGQIVPKNALENGLEHGHLGDAGMVLLRPTGWLWETFRKLLDQRSVYGHERCKAGPDEQILVETMLEVGATFHAIHQRFNWPIGKTNLFLHKEIPAVLHMQGPKPWQNPNLLTAEGERDKAIFNRRAGYYIIWEKYACEILGYYPEFHKYIANSPMMMDPEPINELCMSNTGKHKMSPCVPSRAPISKPIGSQFGSIGMAKQITQMPYDNK